MVSEVHAHQPIDRGTWPLTFNWTDRRFFTHAGDAAGEIGSAVLSFTKTRLAPIKPAMHAKHFEISFVGGLRNARHNLDEKVVRTHAMSVSEAGSLSLWLGIRLRFFVIPMKIRPRSRLLIS